MRIYLTVMLALVISLFLAYGQVIAQDAGDYRSNIAQGNWGDPDSWEVFDGVDWVAATEAPGGDIMVTIRDGHRIDAGGSIVIDSYVKMEGEELSESGGEITFASGSVYEHAQDRGRMPTATWEEGSTVIVTGLETGNPGNTNQSYYNLIWDNPNQGGNEEFRFDGITIGGDLRVINTNGRQFRLTGAGDTTRVVTIAGNVIVEGGNLATTGSSAEATYEVTVLGDVIVYPGAELAIARANAAHATWFLHGDLSIDDARLHDSHGGMIVFDGVGNQNVMFNNVNFSGENINYLVSETSNLILSAETSLEIEADQDFTVQGGLEVQGELVNLGGVSVSGSMAVADGGVFVHAHDGGSVPSDIDWQVGSTMVFTNLINQAPANRVQNYHHFVWDNPDMDANLNVGWGDNVIGGDLRVVATGGRQFRMTDAGKGNNRTITIMGDVIVEGGILTVTGSSGAAEYRVDVMGDVIVEPGANLSLSRGSGGQATWNLHSDLIVTDGTLQDAHTDQLGKIVFAGDNQQALHLTNVNYASDNGIINFVVAAGATLQLGDADLGAFGSFEVEEGAGVATSHVDGLSGNFLTATLAQTPVSLVENATYIFNGTERQVTSELLPGTVDVLVIDNEAGVEQSADVTITTALRLVSGVFFNQFAIVLEEGAEIIEEGGFLAIPLDAVPYRSAVEEGLWSDAASWEVFDADASDWVAADNAPVGESEIITIQQGHNIELTDELEHEAVFLTIDGKVTVRNNATLSGIVIVSDGGVYEHARNGGVIPEADWQDGSTVIISGYETSSPDNRAQDFYHVIWDSPRQSGNENMGWGHNVIRGDVRVINTNGNQWRLTWSGREDGNVIEVDILGSLILEGGVATASGSGGSLKDYFINIGGDLVVQESAYFRLAAGSGVSAEYSIGGDFIVDGGQIQGRDTGTGFVFSSGETQLLRFTDAAFDNANQYYLVSDGTILDLGESDVLPFTAFTVEDGAGVATSSPEGLFGNIPNIFVNATFPETGTYIFNGTEPQVTSDWLPSTVARLVIDNEAGVELSAPVTVTGSLELIAGVFYNGQPVVLGDDAELIIVDGSLAYPLDQQIFQAELLADQEGFDDYFKVVEAEDGDGPYAYIESIADSPDRNDPPAEGFLTIPTTLRGEVNIWLLVNMAGPSSDSFFLGFGDNSRERWWFNYDDHEAEYGTWVWALYEDVTGTNTGPFVATEGNDTLYITRRETEAKLDRVLFTTDLDYVPEDPDRPVIYPPANQLVQAESAADQDGFEDFFQVVESEHGYTYIEAIADAPGFSDAPADGYLTYTTTLNGPLNIWLLVNMPDPDSDSFFIGYDENSVERWWFNYEDHDADYGTWVWALYEDVTGTNTDAFTATGENTLYITRRQAGARLDQILFSTDPDFVPQDPDRPVDTSAEELVAEVPERTELMPNYPNPFNPSTTITYALDSDQHVTITIYNTLGERVATVVNQVVSAGSHAVQFDASQLASGLYLYRMHAQGSGVVQTRKMMLVK